MVPECSCSPAAAYVVEHDEMVLFPMQDGRQRTELAQLFQSHLERRAFHSDLPQRIAYACDTHSFTRQVGQRPQIGKWVVLSVV